MLGAIALMADFDITMKGRVKTDSSTGKAISSRRGLGKTRHINTQYLWVQERVRNKDIELIKIRTDYNPADLMTKYLDQHKISDFSGRLNLIFDTSRHKLAPQTSSEVSDMYLERFGTTA